MGEGAHSRPNLAAISAQSVEQIARAAHAIWCRGGHPKRVKDWDGRLPESRQSYMNIVAAVVKVMSASAVQAEAKGSAIKPLRATPEKPRESGTPEGTGEHSGAPVNSAAGPIQPDAPPRARGGAESGALQRSVGPACPKCHDDTFPGIGGLDCSGCGQFVENCTCMPASPPCTICGHANDPECADTHVVRYGHDWCDAARLKSWQLYEAHMKALLARKAEAKLQGRASCLRIRVRASFQRLGHSLPDVAAKSAKRAERIVEKVAENHANKRRYEKDARSTMAGKDSWDSGILGCIIPGCYEPRSGSHLLCKEHTKRSDELAAKDARRARP